MLEHGDTDRLFSRSLFFEQFVCDEIPVHGGLGHFQHLPSGRLLDGRNLGVQFLSHAPCQLDPGVLFLAEDLLSDWLRVLGLGFDVFGERQ